MIFLKLVFGERQIHSQASTDPTDLGWPRYWLESNHTGHGDVTTEHMVTGTPLHTAQGYCVDWRNDGIPTSIIHWPQWPPMTIALTTALTTVWPQPGYVTIEHWSVVCDWMADGWETHASGQTDHWPDHIPDHWPDQTNHSGCLLTGLCLEGKDWSSKPQRPDRTELSPLVLLDRNRMLSRQHGEEKCP